MPRDRYETICFGDKTSGEIVRDAVLELTYTAYDMAPFARGLGHVDDSGAVKPPFVWDGRRRLRLRAKLDAVFFHLYGIADRDDVRYVYSTFPPCQTPGEGYVRTIHLPRPLSRSHERARSRR